MDGKLGPVGQMMQLGEVRRAQAAVVEAERELRTQCVRAMRYGCTGSDVAEALGLSRATLYRMLERD